MLMGLQGSSKTSSSTRKKDLVEIDGRDDINSVAFLADGKHVVSGGEEGKVRCWGVEDGRGAGTVMDAGCGVHNLAVSRDGKWIVSGTDLGLVTVWNAERHEKVSEFQAHNQDVFAVDISPDATKIATGSGDKTAYVWSLSTTQAGVNRQGDSQRLLLAGPLQHRNTVAAVKFSPDGRRLATATRDRHSIRLYDSRNGRCLVDVRIHVNSHINQSLAWTSDSKRLFALSQEGVIHCLDVSTGTILSEWSIHNNVNARCIALASSGVFIAASANSSVSFWDTETRTRVGPVIEFSHDVWSMAISANDFVAGGDKTISLRSLCDMLPSLYCNDVSAPASEVRHE